jgi:hypothetical protein
MHVQHNFSLFGHSSKFRFSNFICPSVFVLCAQCVSWHVVKWIVVEVASRFVRKAGANVLNKQSRTVSNGWYSSMVWWAGGA